MSLKKLAAGVALSTLAALAANGALAQSTATQAVGELVVTARPQPLGGLVAAQDAPKTRDIVSQVYISTQTAGANAMQVLNLVPGVNFTQDDPFGLAGSAGHISIRGLKGANIAELEDGMPLNDAGNYAVYAGERLDPEILQSVNVITGSSEVDAPSASSLGGTINYNTINPADHFSGMANVSGGSFGAQRYQALIQSGSIGPWGTKGFVEGSYVTDNKFTTGYGRDWKWQVNGKLYQDLHHDGDFAAVSVFYDRQLLSNYFGIDFASGGCNPATTTPPATCSNYHAPLTTGFTLGGRLAAATPWNTDYNQYFVQPPSASANTSFQGLQLNPTDTGNIRGQLLYTLLPNLKLTVDPSYQWVLATGGTLSTTVKGTDPLLIGDGLQTVNHSNYPACTNAAGQITGLNIDGVSCTDTSRITNPSLTQTSRYTVNSSLIWTPSPQHLVRIAYAYDHANVRQTGEWAQIQASGWPTSVFSGLEGWGTPIRGVDGNPVEKRNRLTIAGLNQVSGEYIGKFFDDHLRLDIGLRIPFIARDLHQFCYTNPPTTVTCTSFPAVAATAKATVAPFVIHKNYSQPLPNVGATWSFDPAHQLFIDYTEALNAPVNDDLYAIGVLGTGGSTATTPGAIGVKPETSRTIEGGYRYQTSRLRFTVDGYYIEDNNHIVSAYNQTTADFTDTNVGAIHFYGIEGQAAWVPMDHLTLVGMFAYEHSQVIGNIPYTPPVIIPTDGKQFYDTPPWMVGGRAVYEWHDLVAGVQFKYVDARFVTALNDLTVPSYVTVDLDLRWKLDWIKPGTFAQFNVVNLFDEKYIGSINYGNTNNNNYPYYTQGFAFQGTPRTVQGTLRFTF
jgi:iron complex outermembrane receptor protein